MYQRTQSVLLAGAAVAARRARAWPLTAASLSTAPAGPRTGSKKRPRLGKPKPGTVLISNISWATDEQGITAEVAKACTVSKSLKSVKSKVSIAYESGQHGGYGRVEVIPGKATRELAQALHGIEVDGRALVAQALAPHMAAQGLDSIASAVASVAARSAAVPISCVQVAGLPGDAGPAELCAAVAPHSVLHVHWTGDNSVLLTLQGLDAAQPCVSLLQAAFADCPKLTAEAIE